MPEAIVPITRLTASVTGGSIRKTEHEDQFVVGDHTLYLYLTPEEAAQWADVLGKYAAGVPA